MSGSGIPAAPAGPGAPASPGAPPDRALRVIAVYKFFKAAVTLALAFGTIGLLSPAGAATAERWATALSLRHDRRLLGHLIALVSGLSNRRLHELAIGAFAVTLMLATEGVGLWMGKRWAEYLTVVATSVFVPFEVISLVHVVNPARAATLLLNLAVVAFLIYRLLRRPEPVPRA